MSIRNVFGMITLFNFFSLKQEQRIANYQIILSLMNILINTLHIFIYVLI